MLSHLVTKRFVLHVGYDCNERCRFCYYVDDLNNNRTTNWTTAEVKRRLLFGRRMGKIAVDFSGGEPTIRQDIFELIRYARKLGYTTINLITNGLRASNKEFCQQLVEAGLNDVLFSIHSPQEREHDYLTSVKGSFKKVIQSLENMKALGMNSRVNYVVSNVNYQSLARMFGLLLPYSVAAVNLIVFNPSETTIVLPDDEGVRIDDYWTISREIKSVLDIYKNRFDTINVRFLPFCLLPGHEDVIRTQWQKLYEDQEWDPFMNIALQKGILAAWGSFAAGLFLYPFYTPRSGYRDMYTWFNEVISTFRVKIYYRQLPACRECSLRKICPGLPVDYVRRFNKTELKPYRLGGIIEDPLNFCQAKTKNFESLRLRAKK